MNNGLTTKEVFIIASGEPTHWGVHVFDRDNSRESSEKLVQKIINNQVVVEKIEEFRRKILYADINDLEFIDVPKELEKILKTTLQTNGSGDKK